MIIQKIIFSSNQPTSGNVLWAKPVGTDGMALYLHRNGRWNPMKIMSDNGTATPEDDTVAEISNLSEVVQQEVNRQMENYDTSVQDTHNAAPGGGGEYADVSDLFG